MVYHGFDTSPKHVVATINAVKSWKGASWNQKVFVQALDLLLEKAYDRSLLDPDTYNRLQEHLHSNEHKMQAADWLAHHVWVWDIYHDYFKLQNVENGTLTLPELFKTKKRPIKKPPKKKLRKRIKQR